jgi:hypothetical protein
MPTPDGLLIRCAVQLPYIDGIPSDVSEMVYHFSAPTESDPAAVCADINTAFTNIYNDAQEGMAGPLGQALSRVVDRTKCLTAFWSATDGTVRHFEPLPSIELPVAAADTGSYDMPLQVALCCSFSGPVAYNTDGTVADVSAGRKRGRIFFGPLIGETAVNSDSGYPIPQTTFINTLSAAHAYLQSLSGSDHTWGVLGRPHTSNSSDPHTRVAVFTPITAGWVDNRWDTQRRREVKASHRYTWD